MKSLIFTVLILLSLHAFSEEKKNKKPKTSVLEFDESLRGEARKPQISSLFDSRKFDFKKIIKLRENFLPEMKSDLEKLPLE